MLERLRHLETPPSLKPPRLAERLRRGIQNHGYEIGITFFYGAGIRTALHCALPLIGAEGLVLTAGVGFLTGGIVATTIEYYRQHQTIAADPNANWLTTEVQRFRQIDKGRLGKAFLKGGVIGAAGAMTGAIITDFILDRLAPCGGIPPQPPITPTPEGGGPPGPGGGPGELPGGLGGPWGPDGGPGPHTPTPDVTSSGASLSSPTETPTPTPAPTLTESGSTPTPTPLPTETVITPTPEPPTSPIAEAPSVVELDPELPVLPTEDPNSFSSKLTEFITANQDDADLFTEHTVKAGETAGDMLVKMGIPLSWNSADWPGFVLLNHLNTETFYDLQTNTPVPYELIQATQTNNPLAFRELIEAMDGIREGEKIRLFTSLGIKRFYSSINLN